MKTTKEYFVIPALFAICLVGSAAHASDPVYCDGDGPSASGKIREVVGKEIADCGVVGDEEDPTSLSIIEESSGKLVGTVTTESFGGSYPTNCYDVRDISQDEAGAPRVYVAKGFKLEIDVNAAPSHDGFPGHASAPGSVAGLKNHKVQCTLN